MTVIRSESNVTSAQNMSPVSSSAEGYFPFTAIKVMVVMVTVTVTVSSSLIPHASSISSSVVVLSLS